MEQGIDQEKRFKHQTLGIKILIQEKLRKQSQLVKPEEGRINALTLGKLKMPSFPVK